MHDHQTESVMGVVAEPTVAAAVPMSLEVLELELCRWSANLTAAEARWLSLVAEWDRRRGWEVPGCGSCAQWLAWQTSLDLRTAHEKVRVARALERFPVLSMAMADGSLSYAKARAITRVASDSNVDAFLELALVSTSNQLERIVSGYLRYEPDADDAEARAHRGRRVTIRNEEALGVITIRVPVEAAAVLVGCMERFIDHSDLRVGLAARRADAVMTMAAHAVAAFDERSPGTVEDPYLVTVHLTPDIFEEPVDAELVDRAHDHDHDHCDLEHDHEVPSDAGMGVNMRVRVCSVAPGDGLGADPVSVPRRSARRILCDCVMQGFRHDDGVSDGALRVGAKRRTVSRRLKRALRLRDHGCRFPGCTNAVWVDAHHIVHWLDHGPTVEENLVCLCRHYHRLMHEGGWNITGDANGDPLDLDYTLDVIIGNEYRELRPHYRRRTPLIRH